MFFKKYKMQIEQLQQEKEHLNAQLTGLLLKLKSAEDAFRKYDEELNRLRTQNLELVNEIKHLKMRVATSNTNQNDSRYY